MPAANPAPTTRRENVSRSPSQGEPAIDLVHLARQTDGDVALEAELLAMFDIQALKLMDRLRQSDVSTRAKADIAHRLRGSALAIGATRVADFAYGVEKYYEKLTIGEPERLEELAELMNAVDDARAAITRLSR